MRAGNKEVVKNWKDGVDSGNGRIAGILLAGE